MAQGKPQEAAKVCFEAKDVHGRPVSWSDLLSKFNEYCPGHPDVAELASQTQALSLLLSANSADLDGNDVGAQGVLLLGQECVLAEEGMVGNNALKQLDASGSEVVQKSVKAVLAYYAYALRRSFVSVLATASVADINEGTTWSVVEHGMAYESLNASDIKGAFTTYLTAPPLIVNFRMFYDVRSWQVPVWHPDAEVERRCRPSIERANEFAPQHSRIFKEVVLEASPSKPFRLNNDLQSPAVWDAPNTLTFIRAVVEHTLRRSVSDDADIFRSGGDSLQATWIRNTILRAIRDSDPSAVKRLPMNLVFKAPTISALTNIVHAVMNDVDADATMSHTPHDLWKYVEKYSAGFPSRPTNLVDRPASAKEVGLITGTTGGFGCDALEHLLRDDSIERVYAFNRKGSDAVARQHAQFRLRGLDEALLDTPKFRLVEAVLHEPDFGVTPELLDEVRRSVTHILHNAWKVDFNLSLPSFEVDIQGARNLVNLAISSPFKQAPTILFVSSIGVFMNYHGPSPAPEVSLDDPVSPYGTGYSEGKWVTEHVLQNATMQRDVHTVVMRLGQVTGDRLAHQSRNVTRVPGYGCTKALTELRHSPEPFVHLVHPRPVSWRAVIAPVAAELGVPLVSHSEWLSALQKSVDAAGADEVELMKANPALRLLPFYRGCRASPECEPFGMVYLSTTTSATVSHVLANLPVLRGG
ncbi:male sterility protein-domain-containing protein [Trametes elegans]|nr:male sterility protein-domain-containing protein [Trametes elegans]